MRIELTGSHGSGKSYMAKRFAVENNFIFLDEISKKVIKTVLLKSIFNYQLYLLLLNCIFIVHKSQPKNLYIFYRQVFIFFKVQLRYYVAKQLGYTNLVVSEGIVHRMRMLWRNSSSDYGIEDIPKKVLSSLYTPDIVVVINANLKTRINRCLKRDGKVLIKTQDFYKDQLARTLNNIVQINAKYIILDNSEQQQANSINNLNVKFSKSIIR